MCVKLLGCNKQSSQRCWKSCLAACLPDRAVAIAGQDLPFAAGALHESRVTSHGPSRLPQRSPSHVTRLVPCRSRSVPLRRVSLGNPS